jgi:serine/threonine-protein kinase
MSASSVGPPATDRNLLFGILALQMDFIDRDALVRAMNAWVLDKAKPLGGILREQGKLTAEHHALLEPLVDAHIRAHGNDPQRSLVALSSVSSVRRELSQVADPDVQISLAAVRSAGPTDLNSTVDEPKPSAVRYRILRPHARGGLGEVYVAEDQELHREVALKEIRPERATDPASRGRFLLEAEVTGGLEHPGIVPVYGLGSYADGRLFYAMRFIRGDNLEEAIQRFHDADTPGCDPGERRLAFRHLLRRFVDVCNAVAYAHSRGVLHRDLKPGNVMLGRYGETLLVDWGLAKVVGRPPGWAGGGSDGPEDPTLRPSSGSGVAETQAGTAAGTPAYMSPEQASGRLAELGPASDVYSLGATLYALLTGQASHRGDNPLDVLRRVQSGKVDPPRKLKKDVPAALEAVCLKAMARKPADRYPSALALAADVEHWLADEPVGAYPEPVIVRACRWGRRHRTLVTSAAALLVTALIALAIGFVAVEYERRQTARERDEKDRALDQKDRALQAESAALAAETKAREAETQARTLAMDALRKLTDDVVQQQLARRTMLNDEDRRFLRDIQQQYERFAALPGEEAEQRAVRAAGHLRVGLMRYRLGELKEGEGSYREAVGLYRPLAADFPDRPEFRQDLATSHNNLGVLLSDTGRLQEAEAAFADARALRTQLAAEFPARPEFRQELAASHNNLGVLFSDTGRLQEAQGAFADAVALQKKLAADFPARPEFRQELATSYTNLGILLSDTGRLQEAEAAYTDALALQKKLAADFPARPEFRQELAASHNNLGILLKATDRLKEAAAAYADGLALGKQLAADFPARHECRQELATSHTNLGNLLRDTGRLHEAEAAFADALALQKKLAADFPARPEFRQELATSHNSLGILHKERGQLNEAEAAFADALALQKKLAADFPARPEFRQELALSHNNLGNVLRDTGRLQEAEAAFADALALQKKLAADFPKVPNYHDELAGTLGNLAILANLQRDFALAQRRLKEAQPANQAALAANPKHPVYRQCYRNHLSALVVSCGGSGDQAAAGQAAVRLRDLGWEPPADAYTAACALAQCIPVVEKDDQATDEQRARQARFYADQAMAMLKDAVAMGYKDAAHMMKDTDLDPLRKREDFQKLLADLDVKSSLPAPPDAGRLERLCAAAFALGAWPAGR